MRADEPRRPSIGGDRSLQGSRAARAIGVAVVAATCLFWGTASSVATTAAAGQQTGGSSAPTASGDVPGTTLSFKGGSYELAAGERASDLFVWAQRAVFRGTAEDNVFVGVQVARLESEGRIGGDLFVFAQSATIEGRIDGDVYFWCATLEIGPGAEIAGNLYGGAGDVTLAGSVGGTVDVHAGHTILDGSIGESAEVDSGELRVGSNARIAGDLTYAAGKPAVVDEGAEILGAVQRRDEKEEGEEREGGGWLDVSWWSLGWKLAMFLGSLLVGAFLLWVGGRASREPDRHLADTPARGLGLGFVVGVIMPVVALIGLLFGIVPGVFGFALFFVAVYLARLVTSLCMGIWALRRLRPVEEPSPYVGLSVGLVAFYLITAIPFVGFLFWVAAVIAGLGGLFLAVQAGRRSPEIEVPPGEGDAAVDPG